MSSEIAIKVENLSKCYQIYDQPRDRLKQFVLPRLRQTIGLPRKQYYREFWALKNVSFEVRKGETIGIIGRNGSGKSTLLQMICGTLNPTSGFVKTTGRIAALLELGSGFNPEFTGRENVYLNAAVLGLTKKEIDERFDQIAAFAEIGEFIEQPVKTYSSGMMVRLAFGVIAHVDADILVVDEALAVGDVFFTQKCMRFIENFQKAGGTLLFVSHDTNAILKLCRHGILLQNGMIQASEIAEDICKIYLEQLYSERTLSDKQTSPIQPSPEKKRSNIACNRLEFSVPLQNPNILHVSSFNTTSASFGLGGARILDAGYFDQDGERLTQLHTGDRATFTITLECFAMLKFPAVGLVLKDRLGQPVFTESTTWSFRDQYEQNGLEFHPGDKVIAEFDHVIPTLMEGDYSITAAVAEGYGHDHVQHHLIHEALTLKVMGQRVVHGLAGLDDLRTRISIERKGKEKLNV